MVRQGSPEFIEGLTTDGRNSTAFFNNIGLREKAAIPTYALRFSKETLGIIEVLLEGRHGDGK